MYRNLSRPARLFLTLLLTLAVVLPLFALVPRYLAWQEQQAIRKAQNSFTATVSESLPY